MQSDLWRTDDLTHRGFRQFYREWRPRRDSFQPMMALHGSLTQSGMWNAIVEGLGLVRMLCPDQRGFGRSEDPGDDSCAAFAADAKSLAQELSLDRYAVLAHSFACSIALEVAIKDAARVTAIVLVDPVVRVGPAPSAPFVPPPESFATIKEAMRHFRETEEGNWTEVALSRFVQDIMMQDAQTGRWRFPYSAARLRRLRAFTASPASDYDLFAKARAVHCPLLIFRGGMSKRFRPEAERPFLEAFATKPEIVVCPESGHFPTATEPGIVIDALKHFLEDRQLS
jgi:pimeloyl-ACP methyl ester carboxylesterase